MASPGDTARPPARPNLGVAFPQNELVTGVLVLPGGRLRLGVCLGYNHVEYHALGQDFSGRGRPHGRADPYLRRLWTGEPTTFTVRFDQIHRVAVCPPPDEPIPIW